MKELRGTAVTHVPAPLAQCLALVEAVDGYPVWYPEVVRRVDVLERDAGGLPSRVQTELHLSVGPVTKDFDLPLGDVGSSVAQGFVTAASAELAHRALS